MHESIYLPLILGLPLLSAAILTVYRNTWSKSVIGTIGSGVAAVSFLFTLLAFFQLQGAGDHGGALRFVISQWEIGGRSYQLGLLADQLSMWWLLIVTGVGTLIHIYSKGYMHDDESFGRFFAKLNYFIFAMSTLVMADNFMALVIGWTNVGLASYMLIGFYITRPLANAAQNKAYLTNLVGEVFMLAGIGATIVHYGTFNFREVFEKVGSDPQWATTIGLLILVGAAAKSAQLPLHIWLPDAMQGPTPVSAMLHAATMVTAGVYLIARLYPIFQASPTAMAAVAVVGALSALAGALIATRQNDIKKILAYSTMSQIGYMFLGNGVGASDAAALHFMTHAFFKAALFLGAGIVIHELAGEQDIRKMGGLKAKMPFSFWVFLIGCLALVGIPPFSGFWSKEAILGAVYSSHSYVLWTIGVIAAGLTAFYNTRLFSLVFLGAPLDAAPTAYKSGKRNRRAESHADHGHGHGHGHGHHETPYTMKHPVAILAFLSVVGGALFLVYGDYLGGYFHLYSKSAEHAAHAPLWTQFVVIGVGLLGVALGWRMYGPNGSHRVAEQSGTGEPKGLLGKGFYFDEIYEFLFLSPARAFGKTVSDVFDARGLDGILHGLSALARGLGNNLDWLHSGFIRRYSLTLFASVVVLVAYFAFYVS